MTAPADRAAGPDASQRTVVRVALHVRPRSTMTRVGGTHDGALLVRVVEPAHEGRATTAALRAVADALGLPLRSVTLVRGAAARQKMIEITLVGHEVPSFEERLARLRNE